MISITVVVVGFLVMVGLLFLGLHVATALFMTAVTAVVVYFDGVHLKVYGSQLWSSMEDYILLSIPIYILLGEILVRSGMTDKMYAALAPWLNRLPGGLLHTNIGASAIFSAVSGSSVSTAATITTVALPSFRKRAYDERLVLGSIAAGASLGNLIPPGIAFIVYASLTNTSVAQLYAAALVPSLVLTGLFMAVIVVICLLRPDLAGAREPRVPYAERLRRMADLLGPVIVFAIIMGSVYTGWATVTESAALAVVATLIIAAPFGMTLYVIQTVRREGNIGTVFAGTIPFVAAMVLMMALLIHFPAMANWATQMAR